MCKTNTMQEAYKSLSRFIEFEVGWRLKNMHNIDASDDVVQKIAAYIDDHAELLFDYDWLDETILEIHAEIKSGTWEDD